MHEVRPLALHHVGFVVADIASAMEGFLRSLNASWNEQIWEDPLQRVKVAFLTARPGEPQIELVEPVGDHSPVRRFLVEKGGGLHHCCYETDDLAAELRGFRSRKAILARPPQPAVAFDGRRVAWVITQEKLLVELLETVAATQPKGKS